MSPTIAFFGTPKFSVPILDSLRRSFEISLVVSQPDKPIGKGLHLAPSPVSQYAINHQLRLLRPKSLKQSSFKKEVEPLAIDVAVVVAYGKILPDWLLSWPRQGAVNIHGSLLPRYRGASPISEAILDGQPETGLTLIKMNAQMDEGDILGTTSLPISPNDTTASLSEKMSTLAADWVPDMLIGYLAGDISPTPQNHAMSSYSRILEKADGYIDTDNPPSNLDEMIRAYHPWPGTWTLFKDKRVKFLPEKQVQMEGKKPTALESFLHGYPDFPIKEW